MKDPGVAVTGPPFKFVRPMAARVVDRLPEGHDWMYEVKFDGYRALLMKKGSRVAIRSRNDKDLTHAYPSVAAAARRLRAEEVIVDGEVVAVDATGRPSFQALQNRGAHPGHAVVFYAFDLLRVDGEDLTGTPLRDRRARLPEVLDGSGVLLSVELPGTAPQVIEAVTSLGLEGIVAKRRTSRYTPGERNTAWVKLKLDRQQEFVIGGYRPGPNGVDSLLVGYYEGTGLRFAGKVRAGFTPHLRREVFAQLVAHTTGPFVDHRTQGAHWVGVTADRCTRCSGEATLVAQIRRRVHCEGHLATPRFSACGPTRGLRMSG